MKANFNIAKNIRNSRSVNALSALRKLQGLGLLLCALLFGSLQVWGATTTASFSPTDFEDQGNSNNGGNISCTKSPITVSCDKGYGYSSGQTRLYQNGYLSITSSAGNIKEIAISFTSSSYQCGLNTSYTGLNTTSWTSSQLSGSAARVTGITVTYEIVDACTKSVTVSNGGSSAHGSITSITTSPVATCSSTASDRQVSIIVKPDNGYSAPEDLTIGTKTGTVTSTKFSRTNNYDGTFTFVYRYNKDDNGSISYNAACVANTYTISLNDQDATTAASPSSITATFDSNTGLTGTVVTTLPTKTGYTFGGYYNATGGSGVQLINSAGEIVASASGGGKTYTDASKNWIHSGGVTVYAKWTEKALTNYRTLCCTELGTPTNLNATPNGTGGTVYWDAVANASGYEVSIDGGANWNSTNTNSYTITGQTCGGNTVNWMVRATGTGVYCETGPSASSSFVTSACACSYYSFHYQHGSDWNMENICFTPVSSGNINYLTDELALPVAEWYNVTGSGAGGHGASDAHTYGFTGTTENVPMHFFHKTDKSFGANPQVGNLGGGLGRFHVYGNSDAKNKYVSFIPASYTLNFGTGDSWTNDSTLVFSGKTNDWNETEWYTPMTTLSNAAIGRKVFVGLKTANGYVWCDPYSQKDNLSGLRTKTGPDSWLVGGMSTSYPNKTGKFRIYANSGDKNWYVTFVPYFQLTYNANSGTGAPEASDYVSCEGNDAARTIAISSTEPTRDGYRFMGWATTAERATAGTVDYKYGTASDEVVLTGSLTLYAVWKQLYQVTYGYDGGSGSCAGGSYIQGETVTVCATDPTKPGCDFTGWSYSPSVTVTTGTFPMPASNVTITATWEDHTYTLTHAGTGTKTNTENMTTIKSGDTPLTLHYTCTGTNAFPLNDVSISGGGKASWTRNTNFTWEVGSDKQTATLVITPATTITADVTITINMKTRYTVVWDEHGSTTTEYYASDDNSVEEKTGIADCGEKKFYCWTEDAEFVSDDDTPPAAATFGTISGNKTYYAIFADAVVPLSPGYVKVDNGNDIVSGTYMIASPSQSLAYAGQNSTNSYASVVKSISFADVGKTRIASLPSGAVNLTLTKISTNKFTLKETTGATPTEKYLKGNSSNEIVYIATSPSPEIDNNYYWQLADFEKDEVTTSGQIQNFNNDRFFRYNSTGSGRIAAYQTSASTSEVYLYKLETTTYSNYAKTCTLYDISITTPSGGTVETSPAAGTGVAGEGQTVTVTATPSSCKYLSALKYNDGSDHAISIASTPYTFTMPASDVTVTATFADKSVSSIAANTATHRTLMQGTAFEGEQIRVTYNNGETEYLAWDASGLTFSGYNMSTLGDQTVSVAYVGSCGNANTSYDIEITDGIPVTFSDCGITTVRKYEPGDVVPVETTAGEYACSGWEFVGWSESSVAANSTSFTPVRNFNASTARTLYAVYAHQGDNFISAKLTNELHEGARYILAYYVNNNNTSDGLTGLLPTVKNTNYLQGTHTGNSGIAYTETNVGGLYQYTLTSYTPVSGVLWQLQADGTGYWQLYNIAQRKYLNLSSYSDGYVSVSTTPVGKLVLEDEDANPVYCNGSRVYVKYNGGTKRLAWNRNSGDGYWNQHTSGYQFFLTKDEYFSSNPPCAPQSAVFHGNGGTVIAYGGSPTGGDLTIREATRDAGITTPTAEYEDCNEKSWDFVGWADHEIDVTRIPVLTTDLLNDGGGNKAHTITTDGEEFWAVYTNQGEALTKYGTISFIMSDFSKQYVGSEQTVTKTVSEMGDFDFGYVNVGHAADAGIQFQENDLPSKAPGELYNKTSLGKINSISFNTISVGTIDNLKVYVGDAEKATTYELTSAERQTVGTVVTYYPTHDCEYVYIKDYNSYVCVSGISIDFGLGTRVWATTPDCKRVTLSGDIYATSTNGRGIMAVTPLHINAYQLDASAGIVITSNSTDVYFTEDRTPNFAMAAANQPKTSITVTAGLDGNLSKDVYVHYKPSSAGDGIPAEVKVYANLEVPDPGVSALHSIHVRNLPEKFVIAAKVGAAWYALPADMSGDATNPGGVLIDVDETNMTAIAPNTCSYTLWPVKTVNPNSSIYDRYGTNATYGGNAFGERVRFSAINNGNKGLWANNATGVNTINNNAVIAAVGDGGTTTNTNPSYEWIITTTVTDGKWSYTLQSDQTQNDRYLRYWSAASGGPKWGTYASGEQNLYFLPVTEVEPFEMQVVEWYPTKVLVQTEAALANPTVKVNSESVASPVLTNKGDKLWEISGLPLENNPTKSMTVAFTADEKNYACTKTVPIIISRGTKTQASEPFATLGTAIYNNADLVVRDGAVLTVDGTIAANTFYDVTIYPTSKISVPSSKKLTVHALTFFGGIDEIYDGSAYAINKYGVPELSLKGTLHKSIAQIDYVMRVDDSQMYSLTVPYDVNLVDITYWDGTSMGTLGDKLWVSAYDGAARANKDMSHTWIWEANFASKGLEEKLKAGVGYTISADLQAGVGSTYSILRMPMASNVANDGTELAKTVPVVAYGRESAVSDNHKGWNLVGNPYMVSISGGDADSKLVVGYLQETGTGPWEWVDDEYRYVTIPADNGQDYWQEKFSSATLKPFKNFFLQIATSGDLSFALASRQDAPARYLEAQKREVEFEINLANGSHQDHTGLLIAEEYSPAYEINADLEKMENAMAVYTLTGGYKLAYNALSPDDASQPVPVGYVANIAGTYTFDLDETSDVSEVEHIWLTDYELSRVVDLIDGAYEFTTSNGRNESRFALSVELKDEQQTPTGILNAEADDGRTLKFIRQDKMYILRNGVIYDATGKQVR